MPGKLAAPVLSVALCALPIGCEDRSSGEEGQVSDGTSSQIAVTRLSDAIGDTDLTTGVAFGLRAREALPPA